MSTQSDSTIATLRRIRDLADDALPSDEPDAYTRVCAENAWLRACLKRLRAGIGHRNDIVLTDQHGRNWTLQAWAEQVLSGGPPPAPGEIPDLWGDTLTDAMK